MHTMSFENTRKHLQTFREQIRVCGWTDCFTDSTLTAEFCIVVYVEQMCLILIDITVWRQTDT